MRFVKRPFGHHNSRDKILKKDIITTSGGILMAHTLEEAAKISLCFEALEGKGSLASALKAEAKKTLEKFTKANPDFKFSTVGRRMGSSPTKKADPKTVKLPKASKSGKVAKAPKKAAKPTKAAKKKAA